MNILYVLNSGEPGGMEVHVLDLVKGMKQRGNDVFVWCKSGAVSEWYKEAGAYVVNMDIKSDIDLGYIISLVKFIKQHKIQILHAHELKAVTNTLLAGFLSGVKVRVTHTHTPISEWKINALKQKINLFGYSIIVNLLSSVEICLTESRKNVKIKEGINSKKLCVIGNGIDLDKFGAQLSSNSNTKKELLKKVFNINEAFIFGFIARMTEEKGHKVLVEAFSKLFLRHNINGNILLVLAGGGKLERDVKEQIETLGLSNKVYVSGVFEEKDKYYYYSLLDAFIFPTLAEGFGIVLIEAMAVGLPIISSDLEVLQEVGDGTILFFEAGNSDDLAEKMYDLYIRRDKLQNLGISAKERVRELYSMDRFVNNYENLYINLLGKGGM
ncbi:hypothetical protein A3H26_02725 [candidate division WWE3 bacterium RIFCSPLOWO2_12_FULL_36_10]|uniref:Glycosyl transferase family 1 domain-containing protein n=1 Tax=candidate division WWE3 bacterium RIFCSPLOWO2_12_FULL_36_10 TaxID=1802630 RepID=A0A1F4VG80_UNCKA|nr:MAG: hypothetical protein A3H26_02725 [candidate division WWE3 bacterium RIFCSPLOWO2_12_FULL_36_10]